MAELLTDEQRELQDLARDLGKLKESPAWAALRRQYDKASENARRNVANSLFGGGASAPPVDQRAIDYQRGFLRGAKWILDNPEHTEVALQHALRNHSE